MATASEPLSLEEEYSMQESWRRDADKLTFIICLPRENQDSVVHETDDAPSRMIGDVNLFLTPDEDQDRTVDGYKPLVGELEIMLARKDLHRRGYATAALKAFMSYIFDSLPGILAEYAGATTTATPDAVIMRILRVKIGQDNTRSIALFQKLGFEQVSDKANYFGEIELRVQVETDWREVADKHSRPTVLQYRRREENSNHTNVSEIAGTS